MKWHWCYTQSIFVSPHFGNSTVKQRLMQTCTAILIKCCLVRNFRPLTNVVSQEQVQRGGNLHILLGACKRDFDGFQGGKGSFEKRGQSERAKQLSEKEEPSLLLVQVQKLTRNIWMRNIKMMNIWMMNIRMRNMWMRNISMRNI